MLPAGVETSTPSQISFFINIFFSFIICNEAACLPCLNNEISLIAKDSQVPFTLECNISENGDMAKATLEINAELNMMMKMMLEKPLANFLNSASEGLKKL